MMKNNSSITSQLVVGVVFAVLTIFALWLFIDFAEPPERKPNIKSDSDYDEQPLLGELTEQGLQQRLAEIKAASLSGNGRQIGRLPGTPGFEQTASLIERTFRQAGLDVIEQRFQVVVPVTEYCEILGEDGKPLPGVTLYPFEPSGLVPMVTPPAGVSGKLVVTESTNPLDLVGKPVENSIVLNKSMGGVAWPALASMAVKAVIVKESEAEVAAQQGNLDAPLPWASMLTQFDVQYPRFYVRGPLEKFAGQELTVRCKVTWQSKPVKNIIGVLRGGDASREALIVNAYYDSYSVIPELAPGAEQSISLATLLELAQAMAPYKGQLKRDVIFTAVAGHCQAQRGTYKLLEAIERFSNDYQDYKTFESQVATHKQRLQYVRRALDLVNSDEPWTDAHNGAYRARWMKENPTGDKDDGRAFRAWFVKAFATVSGEVNLAVREDYLQSRIEWIRRGRPTFTLPLDQLTAAQRKDPKYQHPLMKAYIDRKILDTEAGNVISTPFWMVAYNLKAQSPSQDYFTEWQYREKARAYFQQLAEYHTQQLAELEDKIKLRNLFVPDEGRRGGYDRMLTVNLELYSGGIQKDRDLCVLAGMPLPGTKVEPQSTELQKTLQGYVPAVVNGADPEFQVASWGTKDATGNPGDVPIHNNLASEIWYRHAEVAFTVANRRFFPARLGTPDDTFENISTELVTQHTPVVGRTLLAIAKGHMAFKRTPPVPGLREFVSCYGTLYTSAGTASIVPTHPMGQNTFVHVVWGGASPSPGPALTTRGIVVNPILQVNPYGQYEVKYQAKPQYAAITVDAARFDNNGIVSYYKYISTTRGMFQNELVDDLQLMVGGNGMKQLNLSLFRCSQVACFQKINPKTFNSFPAFEFMQSIGMQPPEAVHAEISAPQGIFAYMPPDTNFYVAMKDGSPANPSIQTYRGFLLNVTNKPEGQQDLPALTPLTKADKGKPRERIKEAELYGYGYLAADWPNLTFPYFDGAESMLRTNLKRLTLQNNYFMADDQMLDSQEQGQIWLEKAKAMRAKGDPFSAVNAAGKSFAYAINNHPVIRSKISNAVFGIIWYLAILVPFVFFFEKLVFGFTDIRKQLLAVGAFFIFFFLLLRQFHPAFKMVSNPLVILLGFLIFLLSLFVTIMISGKFQQVVKSIRKREGTVEGADVNRGGVIGTAFMLGLNNMRRRKVRTGLTCVTLVLITFVMICFTSVTTNLVDVEYPTGKAPSNGIVRRDPSFQPITDVELQNIQSAYGLDYPVSVQRWIVGGAPTAAQKLNTTINIDRKFMAGTQAINKRGTANAAMVLQWNEPQFTGIDKYLTTSQPENKQHALFPPPPNMAAVAPAAPSKNYVIIPDCMARELNLTEKDVETGEPTVVIRGLEFIVRGIFDSVKLDTMLGMDGQSILPYDLNSPTNQGRMASTNAAANQQQAQQVTRPRNIDRLKAAQVIILSTSLPKEALLPEEQNIAVYCSVLLPEPDQEYKLRADLPARYGIDLTTQKMVISEYLERLGIGTYYAKGGIAYYGYRARKKTLEGLLELFIPLFIAALTVFNTMRGSVYERKDEIYVYNAVGIAPNHIFFMFMAEACVYAVIGAMLGYLLSQVTGSVMVALNLTSGLNMDYSSIETIYASLAIVISVLVSTILPAHTASRMALPSDEMSWSVPKADGDIMRFNLPFTFSAHDRIAVISYFYRWLDANGEGSSGPFYCAPPRLLLNHSDAEVRSGGLIPAIETTVWLKPYDLGVSQRLTIDLPTDPETDEYIAHISIERLSGTISAWERAVMPFLGSLRKQFLNWRAVSDEERAEMFEEAKELFTKTQTVEETRETVNV
ncbi:MAG: ABC transporter permease [Armatimonadota bacterium]